MSKIVDVGDDAQVADKKNKLKFKRDTELLQLKAILRSKGGRAFLWRVIGECGIFSIGLPPTEEHLAHAKGKRDMGVWLINEIINADQNAYLLMQAEAIEETKND